MKAKKGSVVKQEKDGQTQKLKRRIYRLEQENKELVRKNNKLASEIATLEAAFEESKKLIIELDGETSLDQALERAERLVKYKKQEKKRKAAKVVCPECGDHEIKQIPSRAGAIIVCSKCEYRGVKKK